MVPLENFSSEHNAGHQSVSGTEKLLKMSLTLFLSPSLSSSLNLKNKIKTHCLTNSHKSDGVRDRER